jgi:hypothetical protein
MWEIVSTFGSIAAVYIGFHGILWLSGFLNDPEQTLERLGGLVAAFRRGLAGKVSGRTDSPVSPPGADSRQSE